MSLSIEIPMSSLWSLVFLTISAGKFCSTTAETSTSLMKISIEDCTLHISLKRKTMSPMYGNPPRVLANGASLVHIKLESHQAVKKSGHSIPRFSPLSFLLERKQVLIRSPDTAAAIKRHSQLMCRR